MCKMLIYNCFMYHKWKELFVATLLIEIIDYGSLFSSLLLMDYSAQGTLQ